MPSSGARVRPNTDEVAAKIMDGEAILINLTTGMYYSMDLVGGLVWELIEGEATVAEIEDAITVTYDAERPRVEADLQRLLDQLLEAGLVRLDSSGPGADAGARRQPPAPRLAYEPPRLNAYDDMAELLALDPPHPLLTSTLSKFERDTPSS